MLGRKINAFEELPPQGDKSPMTSDIKYIGYLELGIADSMWPSGLSRAGPTPSPTGHVRLGFDGLNLPHCST
jgi:hypothetical protein